MVAQQRFEVKNKGNKAEIWLYSEIGDGYYGGVSAQQFQADLKAAGAVDEIVMYINSPGGDVFQGLAIYNQLARHQARKMVKVDGLAASIASIIAMSGDEIEMAANSMMMIHDPWAMTAGSAADLRKTADSLDKVRDSLLDTYVKRTDIDSDKVAAMMAEETWMNAAEAVELGFADRTGDDIKLAAAWDMAKFGFRNAPKLVRGHNWQIQDRIARFSRENGV